MRFNSYSCVNIPSQVVGHDAPAICDHVWERCEGLRSLTKYLQLALAVTVSEQYMLTLALTLFVQGCPTREGMVDVPTFLTAIFAAPLLLTSFVFAPLPTTAVVGTLAAAFPPLIPNFISDETSTNLQLAASPTAATGIVLVGGNSPSQGNVYAQDPRGRWGAVCGSFWTITNAQVVCRQLGQNQAIKFYGVAPVAGPPVDGPGSRYGPLPFGTAYVLERVACAGTESRLVDCPILSVAAVPTVCDANTVAGVECV